MRRRSLMKLAGSISFLWSLSPFARGASPKTALQRIAEAAQVELDGVFLKRLRNLGTSLSGLTPEMLTEAIATDFRSERTVVVGRVLLSHHEIALALAANETPLSKNRTE